MSISSLLIGWITSINNKYNQAKIKSVTGVNSEMLRFYFELALPGANGELAKQKTKDHKIN